MGFVLDPLRRMGALPLAVTPQSVWQEYPDLVLPSSAVPVHSPERSDAQRLDALTTGRRKIRRGETLYREGERFRYLHAVQSGSFKSTLALPDGDEQVCSFQMAGQLLGLDGVADGHHASSATALEDSEISTLSYEQLNELCGQSSGLQRCVMRLISNEIVRSNQHVLLLGRLHSARRLASFLLGQSQHLSTRGFSALEFHLKMTRGEIGSFLGMTLETVSRTFTELQQQRLLTVERRHIVICSLEGLALV